MIENTLVVIPARGGSKGIPKKNSRLLAGKPLILHTTSLARQLFSDQDICVSTDSLEIREIVTASGLSVPFIRPSYLATDQATTQDVLLHALEHYRSHGRASYDKVLLLQPTSPFRRPEHIREGLKLFSPDIDMVVSVVITKANPYYTLFEADARGFLKKSKEVHFTRRQDCPTVFQLNGSIYVINTKRMAQTTLAQFDKIIPYPMDETYSVDIDTELDWKFAEVISQSLAT